MDDKSRPASSPPIVANVLPSSACANQDDPLSRLFAVIATNAGAEHEDAAVDALVEANVLTDTMLKHFSWLSAAIARWQKEINQDPSKLQRNASRIAIFRNNSYAASVLLKLTSANPAWHERHRARFRRSAYDDALSTINAVVQELKGNVRTITFPSGPLTSTDEELCCVWAGLSRASTQKAFFDALGGYHAMRLISARQAERTAARYYTGIGRTVHDVSIGQVTGECQAWMTHDLEIDGRAADVKNARRSFSSPGSYSEYCVSNWKLESRAGDAVSIVGVLSDYVTRERYAKHWLGKATVLGEVRAEQLRRAARWAEAATDGKLRIVAIDKPKFFPGWVFDYPPDHYGENLPSREKVRRVIEDAIACGLPLEMTPLSLLPHCDGDLRSLANLRESTVALLNDVHDMHAAIGFSRSSATLFLLVRFVNAVNKQAPQSFDASELGRLLFLHSVDGTPDETRPLGRLDTEKFVHTMLCALNLAVSRCQDQLLEFRNFQLAHANVLRGEKGDGQWVTIIAYCGGFLARPPYTRCGKSPLVLGECDTCPNCHHLICTECGWCSDGCDQLMRNPLRQPRDTVIAPSELHNVQRIADAESDEPVAIELPPEFDEYRGTNGGDRWEHSDDEFQDC